MRADEGLSVEVRCDGGVTEIVLGGVLDDRAGQRLEQRAQGLEPPIRFNFRDVSRVTSAGLGILMRLLSALKGDHTLEFAECSSVMVDQFQMLEFSRYGRITSFVAWYLCDKCSSEISRLVDLSELSGGKNGTVEAKPLPCSCGGRLVIDEPLDFVHEHLPPRR